MAERQDSETLFAYVGFATASQIWNHIKAGLGLWAGLAIFGAVIGLFVGPGLDGAADALSVDRNLGLPDWVWLVGLGAYAWWLLKGQTIPNVTLKELLCVTGLVFGAVFLAVEVLPQWLGVIPISGLGAAFYVAEQINQDGKKNYKRLRSYEALAGSR